MNETQMMIAAAAVMVVVAFIGFKLLKSLLKAVVLGVGLSAGVAIAWKLGILPRETPTVVETTGKKVERGVKDIAETVTRGAKQAADEVQDASRVMERTTTRAVKKTVKGVESSVEGARDRLEEARAGGADEPRTETGG